MSAILFCSFYILLFSAIIMRSKWFTAGGLSNKYFLGAFYLKLLFGVGLWFIYTHIYKNRLTNDIFKYYDDAQMMFSTLHTSAKDYFTLLTGIGDFNTHLQAIYHTMSSWDNGYDTAIYNNSHFIIRLNAFFMLFSHGHYGVHVIFMCFIAFVGLTYIYKAFIPFLQGRSKLLFAAVFLFPSVILWSSGILKESLVWLGLGLSVYQLSVVSGQSSGKRLSLISHLLSLFLGFVILFESKAYVLLCIFPCFVAQLLVQRFKARPLITYVSVLVLYISAAFLPHILFGKVSPLKMIADKQMEFNKVSKGGIYLSNMKDSLAYSLIPIEDSISLIPLNSHADSLLHRKGVEYLAGNKFWYNELKTKNRVPFMLRNGSHYSSFRLGEKDTLQNTAGDSSAYCICLYIEPAKSAIYIQPIKPDLFSLLKNVPQALKIAMLLPYPWQIHSAMTGIYCMENIFVLLLIFVALFFIKRPIPHKDVAYFCLFFTLLMLILIGLVTPILGGIERYKSVVIPFMFILLLLITDKDKILQKFKIPNK